MRTFKVNVYATGFGSIKGELDHASYNPFFKVSANSRKEAGEKAKEEAMRFLRKALDVKDRDIIETTP